MNKDFLKSKANVKLKYLKFKKNIHLPLIKHDNYGVNDYKSEKNDTNEDKIKYANKFQTSYQQSIEPFMVTGGSDINIEGW